MSRYHLYVYVIFFDVQNHLKMTVNYDRKIEKNTERNKVWEESDGLRAMKLK